MELLSRFVMWTEYSSTENRIVCCIKTYIIPICRLQEWLVNSKSYEKQCQEDQWYDFLFFSVWTKCHTNLHKWYRNWACERNKKSWVSSLVTNCHWQSKMECKHWGNCSKGKQTTFYVLKLIKNACPNREYLVDTYTSLVRPTVEYACPVWHAGLPQYLPKEVETIQMRALTTIYGLAPYEEHLCASGLVSLKDRSVQCNVQAWP